MISHQEAKRHANEHLRADGTRLVAGHATRNQRYGVWFVSYVEPERPDEMLIGGGLVVTDDGDVHDVGSVPGSLDDLMLALGRWPGAEPADVLPPATDTDSEALLLLADLDPDEAEELAAWAEARRLERGEGYRPRRNAKHPPSR